MRKIEQEALYDLDAENYDDNYGDDVLNEADIDDETAGILIDRMFEVLGDEEFTEDQMWQALVQTGFDAELAVDRLLNPLKKTKSKQDDKSSRVGVTRRKGPEFEWRSQSESEQARREAKGTRRRTVEARTEKEFKTTRISWRT